MYSQITSCKRIKQNSIVAQIIIMHSTAVSLARKDNGAHNSVRLLPFCNVKMTSEIHKVTIIHKFVDAYDYLLR